LIRQITINCEERGLLLLRVRDEAKMTIAAYETLYESSIAFGIRKALMAEFKRSALETRIKTIHESKRNYEREVKRMKVNNTSLYIVVHSACIHYRTITD
jgi:dynein light intermediate chain